jgi:hypothetical protein
MHSQRRGAAVMIALAAALPGFVGCDLARSDLPGDGGSLTDVPVTGSDVGDVGNDDVDTERDAVDAGPDARDGAPDSCAACPSPPNGAPVCPIGICDVACQPGYLRCVISGQLSCNPARWDFESGTAELWNKEFGVSPGAPDPMVDPVAHGGSYSLAQATGTASSGHPSAGVTQYLCPSIDATADLRGKTLTLWYRLSGGALAPGAAFTVCASRYRATTGLPPMVDCRSPAALVLDTWSRLEIPFTAAESDVVSLSITFVSPDGGVYRIDDLSIE